MENTFALRYYPYTLELRHVFRLATSSRSTTPAVIVEVEKSGIIGYGEASLPPYLGESLTTVDAFLSRVDLSRYEEPLALDEILSEVDRIAEGNSAAKAALDIALHDWLGKSIGLPWFRIWGLDPSKAPPSSYTIGIDTEEVVRQKVREAEAFKILKVKLGGPNDREMIGAIRQETDKPVRVDVNQGWSDREGALREIEWLALQGVECVEQPLPKDQTDDAAWLRERSPIPIIGDEAVQRLADVHSVRGVYDGINIKLMKCTGMREAHAMITLARGLGLKTMLGCMTETSCAISAAAQLSSLVDWVDLDGAALIANDPFRGARLVEGRIMPTTEPGIGVTMVSMGMPPTDFGNVVEGGTEHKNQAQ